MKLHFITFEVKGPRSIIQGQLSKVSKAKIFMKIHFKQHKKTVHNIIQFKFEVSKKLHFFTFDFQGQLSKVSKAKISVTSMKYTSLNLNSKVQGQLSKVNYPRSIIQSI